MVSHPGKLIKRTLVIKGYHQETACNICGLSRFTLNNFLNHKKKLSEDNLQRLCRLIQLDYNKISDQQKQFFIEKPQKKSKKILNLEANYLLYKEIYKYYLYKLSKLNSNDLAFKSTEKKYDKTYFQLTRILSLGLQNKWHTNGEKEANKGSD